VGTNWTPTTPPEISWRAQLALAAIIFVVIFLDGEFRARGMANHIWTPLDRGRSGRVLKLDPRTTHQVATGGDHASVDDVGHRIHGLVAITPGF
jgi:hypothetical protein